MGKLTDKWSIRLLTALGCMVYFCSYITRINFAAVLVEFIAVEQVSKAAVSIVTSALFVTYGFGQIISGYLGDRVSPRKLIFGGLLTAVGCNVLMPIVSPNITLMAVIWGINGFAQAFMWPPLMKILTVSLTEEDYARIVPYISVSSSCATIAIYLVSPVIIHLFNWKVVFAVSATIALIAALMWMRVSHTLLAGMEDIHAAPRKNAVKTKGKVNGFLLLLLSMILLSIAIQGLLRDGITTWMPTLVSEVFQMESTVSILTGVALPIFSTLASLCTYAVLKKARNDVFSCIIALFLIVAILLGVLGAVGMDSAAVCVVIIAVSIGFVTGINLLQTSYLPVAINQNDNVSFLAGLLNSATYVGSALSTYLFARISEGAGWNAVVSVWSVLAMIGMVLSVICLAVWKKQESNRKEN